MTEFETAIVGSLQANNETHRPRSPSIDERTPLEKVPDIEADFQIWDLEENYTGKHNIKARKSTPTDVLAPFDLTAAREKGTVPELHRIINKYASSVLSYDKTDSNVLKGFVFNLQMLENHDTFHSKPYNLSPELEMCLDDLMDEYLEKGYIVPIACLLYTSPSPRDS